MVATTLAMKHGYFEICNGIRMWLSQIGLRASSATRQRCLHPACSPKHQSTQPTGAPGGGGGGGGFRWWRMQAPQNLNAHLLMRTPGTKWVAQLTTIALASHSLSTSQLSCQSQLQHLRGRGLVDDNPDQKLWPCCLQRAYFAGQLGLIERSDQQHRHGLPAGVEVPSSKDMEREQASRVALQQQATAAQLAQDCNRQAALFFREPPLLLLLRFLFSISPSFFSFPWTHT